MDNYRKHFTGGLPEKTKAHEAWKTAMDVRKFEIDLYWKRATYFWTFIALAIAAYGAVLFAEDLEKKLPNKLEKSDVLFAVAALGLVFSVAWYFVNRGSKFWQRNWEYHAESLEDEVIGPLYKTVMHKSSDRFCNPMSAYPFTVSNINVILSLVVVSVFVALCVFALPWDACWECTSWSVVKIITTAFAAVCLGALGYWGRTSTSRAKLFDDTGQGRSLNVSYSQRSISIQRKG